MNLTSIDNSYAGLTNLPTQWKNLTWVACGTSTSGDMVSRRTLNFTQIGSTRGAGSYDFEIHGGGPRIGSVLRVYGSFDVVPKAI